MPVTQSTCTSNFPPNPNSAVPLPPYSLSCSALSSAASTFFTRSKNPIFKPNSAPFLRAKPQRGARLIASAAGTDYYKTLNVPRTATLQEIKSAYRKLARKYHPDKGGGAEGKFKEISAAYEMAGKGLYMFALVKLVYRENMIPRPWVHQGWILLTFSIRSLEGQMGFLVEGVNQEA